MPYNQQGKWSAWERGNLVDAGIGGYAVGLPIGCGEHARSNGVMAEAQLELTLQNEDTNDPKFKFADIEMPCGQHVEHKLPEDVPTVNTLCPCGNPRHWLVLYVEIPEG